METNFSAESLEGQLDNSSSACFSSSLHKKESSVALQADVIVGGFSLKYFLRLLK